METLNELRLGNWVKFEDGLWYQVYSIHGDHTVRLVSKGANKYGHIGCFGSRGITGISLTEDWLLRCGFVKHGNHFYLGDFMFFTVYADRVDLTVLNWKENWIPFPKCVHELQNLYFAFTQKELIFI